VAELQATPDHVQSYLLQPIVVHWFHRFDAARKAKERFDIMAKLCRQFLGSSAKAMWEDSFRKEFYPQVQQPQFMVSLNKAFELVAIIGPSLYWNNPVREIHSPDMPDQTELARMFGIDDEQMLEQVRQQQEQTAKQQAMRNNLVAAALEYQTRQQPGNVKYDIEMAIQDGLVTGRGCMWTEAFKDLATGEVSIGSFFDSVDNLLIDPDARDPRLRDVKWIARRHVESVWEVERRFGYPQGYLKNKGTHVSAEWASRTETVQKSIDSPLEMYADQIEWYEIWSTCGIGARVTGINAHMGQQLDQLTGDYCYLCVAPNMSHPLNLPPALIQFGQPDEIREAMRWRTPKFGVLFELWKDRRWPVEVLDFYPVVGSCWPMAVLGPGIGALLAMNLLLVTHLQMSWDRRRDILATYEHTVDQVMQAIQGENNPAVIKVSAASDKPVADLLAYIQRPEVQGNLLEWVNYLDQQFQMATGLDDIHYGISAKQARVNSDVEAKQKAANVRPEKMAKDVHNFIVNIGTKETWLTTMYTNPQTLTPIIGPWGVMAWNSMVKPIPFETLVREMECWVDATDIQRPNREKDMADLEKLAPFLLQMLTNYAQMTGDEKPLNAFITRFGYAAQIRDIQDFFMGPWHPAPDPMAQQAQQAQMAADVQLTQAQAQEMQAKAAARLVDAQFKQAGATPQQLAKLRWDQIFNQQKLRMQDESHLQQMVHLQEQNDIQLEAAKKAAAQKGAK